MLRGKRANPHPVISVQDLWHVVVECLVRKRIFLSIFHEFGYFATLFGNSVGENNRDSTCSVQFLRVSSFPISSLLRLPINNTKLNRLHTGGITTILFMSDLQSEFATVVRGQLYPRLAKSSGPMLCVSWLNHVIHVQLPSCP